MFTLLKRTIRSGYQNCIRNWGAVAATVFIITITVFLIASIYLLNLGSEFLIASLRERIDLAVYFKEDVLPEDILKVKEEVKKISEVKDVEYVSKDDALKNFIERHKEDATLMESLIEIGDNPFLASLNIKAKEAGGYETISNFLASSSFNDLFEKVDYYQRKPVIEKIDSITANMNRVGIILSAIFAVLAVLVTFNTIRLAIYNSREEIATMRLVGASNWFIRGPFLVEGAIAGVLSAFLCFVILPPVLYFLSPKIEGLFPGLNFSDYWLRNFWTIAVIQFSTGIGLGVISSMIAIRRYLRV